MALKSELYQKKVNMRENVDVAWLMSFAAEKDTVDPWTAKLLKRASVLLRETTGCWHDTLEALKDEEFALGSERLLRAIFMSGKDDNDDPDDEAD
ncbi:MAG: hypothetical protein IKI37_04730 [Oscillospiraceae bacterium]|nr:hypothetical protein [Oscillospiraceae bacterium]